MEESRIKKGNLGNVGGLNTAKRTDRDEIRRKMQGVPFWWHSIELTEGIVTPGHKSRELLQKELHSLCLPDLSGKTVLDIGAWDGFYSFEAERRGATRVVALDHYVWSMDIPAMMSYWNDCRLGGVVPQQYDAVPGIWRPSELPGKRGFDLARDVLGSRVESIVADFTTMELDTLGKFDITLYLGVLYHMHDPFRSLRRLAQVTTELAIIETVAVRIPGYEQHLLWEFYENNELNADVSNWWAPSQAGLLGMLRAAGFSRVERLTGEPPRVGDLTGARDFARSKVGFGQHKPIRYRAVFHAWK